MVTPTAMSLSNFTGPVTLDDATQEAWFGFTVAANQNASILMVRDPSPGGAVTQNDVVAMWQFYKSINWTSGGMRTVVGHTGYPPNGTQPLLFVVRG